LILLAHRPYGGLLRCALGLLLLTLVFCALMLYFRPYTTISWQRNLRTGSLGNSQNTLPSGYHFEPLRTCRGLAMINNAIYGAREFDGAAA
jgi:hypothetical protein